MITGDNQRTALAIARQLGLAPADVSAEVRPEQKAELVSQLQKQGERVAFVGDGINDAPALEQADLGVAVSQASDIAGEAADLVLLQSDIRAIPEAIDLARATLRTIKQNLFWAFFYNAAAVPLAALGFLSPILCAAAMGFSDLVVIGNALRLNRRLSAAPPLRRPTVLVDAATPATSSPSARPSRRPAPARTARTTRSPPTCSQSGLSRRQRWKTIFPSIASMISKTVILSAPLESEKPPRARGSSAPIRPAPAPGKSSPGNSSGFFSARLTSSIIAIAPPAQTRQAHHAQNPVFRCARDLHFGRNSNSDNLCPLNISLPPKVSTRQRTPPPILSSHHPPPHFSDLPPSSFATLAVFA